MRRFWKQIGKENVQLREGKDYFYNRIPVNRIFFFQFCSTVAYCQPASKVAYNDYRNHKHPIILECEQHYGKQDEW